MNDQNDLIYLPIRAFGDFIITAYTLKNAIPNRLKIILPNYLFDLYEAIEGDKYFEIIGQIDYNKPPLYFMLYKLKSPKNIFKLYQEFKVLFQIVNKNNTYILDFSSRRLAFIGAKFIWPHKDENIYNGHRRIILEGLNSKPELNNAIPPHTIQINCLKKILIIPESRVLQKSLQSTLIHKIIDYFVELEFTTAYFKKEKIEEPGHVSYSNFNELIKLINSYDLIISAESLPYHLANYLNKPHFVIFNKTRHFNSNFMTPFMIDNGFYSTFRNNNCQEVLNKLESIFYKK